uniref:Uncharacterized protein n=1 Tax=Ditylenchus dipsaci TaxID=166011 RepID=A0A915DXP9_9BILA
MAFYNSRSSTRVAADNNYKTSRRIEMSPDRTVVKVDSRYLDREYGFSTSAQWTRSPVRGDNNNHSSSFGNRYNSDNSDRHQARRSRDRDDERTTHSRDYDRRGSPRGRRDVDHRNSRYYNIANSHRSRSPRRRDSQENDDVPYYRSFASRYARQSEQNKPVMRLFDPANVPRGRNYFEHDSRDDVEGDGGGSALDNSYSSSKRMYDPRNDFDLHHRSKERSDRRSDGWSYHNSGAGLDSERDRQSQGKFIPRTQYKSSDNDFFSRKRPLDLDEPWVHDKFEELVKEERSPRDRSSKHQPEDECLSDDDQEEDNELKKEEPNEDEEDEEEELAIKRRLTANLRKRELRSRSRS